MTQVSHAYDGRIEMRSTQLFVLEGKLKRLREDGYEHTVPIQENEDWVTWLTPPKQKPID